MSTPSITPIKKCTNCGVTKPLTPQFFHRKTTGREIWKFQPACKVCRNLHNKAYHAADPDRQKRYWQRTRPERLKYSRMYYQTNKERLKAEAAEYRDKNNDQVKATIREWNRRNKDRKLIHSRNYKALKRNAIGSHTIEEVRQLGASQDWLCAYCKVPLEDYHVDHIVPLSRGGYNSKDNLAITCPTCNLRKGTKTAEEFMDFLQLRRWYPCLTGADNALTGAAE